MKIVIKKGKQVFYIDGSDHIIGDEDCCGSFAKDCEKCGGIKHYQPMYGGFIYKCDKCFDIDSIHKA